MAIASPRIAAGTTLRCPDGRRILLGREVKRGGAGTVHLLPQTPQQVAKIYHPGSDLGRQQRKLAAMLALSPELPDIEEPGRRYVQIAWPLAALHDDRENFVGFLMPALDLASTSELECILQERQARKLGLPTGLGARMTLATNLAAVVAELHRRGHRVIDLKPVNLRFYPRSLYLAVLDCDGFSIAGQDERFPAEQVTPDYLAPELQRRRIEAGDEERQDRFALAVMIFQLINHGIHPYAGKPLSERVPTDLPGRIAGDYYAYGQTPHPAIAPTPGSSHELIPPDLRSAFDLSFAKHAPERIAAVAWRDLLRGYATRSTGRLVVCARNAEHQHFAGFDCGSCRRLERLRQLRAKPTAGTVQGARKERSLPPRPPAIGGKTTVAGKAQTVRPLASTPGSNAPIRRRPAASGVLKVRAVGRPRPSSSSGLAAPVAVPPVPASPSPSPRGTSGRPQDPMVWYMVIVAVVFLAAYVGFSVPGLNSSARQPQAEPAHAASDPPVAALAVTSRLGLAEVLALPHRTGMRREFADAIDGMLSSSLTRLRPLPTDRVGQLAERFRTDDPPVLSVRGRWPVGTKLTVAWFSGTEPLGKADRVKTSPGFEQADIPLAVARASRPGNYRMILLMNEVPVQAIDFVLLAADAGEGAEAVPLPAPPPGGKTPPSDRHFGVQTVLGGPSADTLRLQSVSCPPRARGTDPSFAATPNLRSFCVELVGALRPGALLELSWWRAPYAPVQRADVDVVRDTDPYRRVYRVDVVDGLAQDYLLTVSLDDLPVRQMWLQR